MKRLAMAFSKISRNDEQFKSIYMGAYLYDKKGRLVVLSGDKEVASTREQTVYYDNTYEADGVFYTVERSGKKSGDRPYVLVKIPLTLLGGVPAFEPDSPDGIVFADYALRRFCPYIRQLDAAMNENGKANRGNTARENGAFYCYPPSGGEILARSSAGITAHNGELCCQLLVSVQLPVGNPVKAGRMMCKLLPGAVNAFAVEFESGGYREEIALHTLRRQIRAWLRENGFAAFVANGSVLPRAADGIAPMSGALPFVSPPENEIEICGVRGMGVREGVTVVTGGGYSGKSTLLDAIGAGVFDHISGDGRELVVTDESAVQICAEDGRSVTDVNISPFLGWLRSGDTAHFSTAHASGSTSEAANIMEACLSGSRLLLIDEDRSATNFMIRDGLMKALIRREPITPFTDRVRELYALAGVSTILVIGGSGEYLSVADDVILMDDLKAKNATAEARMLAGERRGKSAAPADWSMRRRLLAAEGFTSFRAGGRFERAEVSEMGYLILGEEKIDSRGVAALLGVQMLAAAAMILRTIEVENTEAAVDVSARLDALYQRIASDGLDSLYTSHFSVPRSMELPHKRDVLALVNRMRGISPAGEEGNIN